MNVPARLERDPGTSVWVALAIVAAAIAYASLYPFDFAVPPAHERAWPRFWEAWRWSGSRSDALGNVLLFVPFGWAGCVAARRGRLRAWAYPATAVISLLLALALQLAQIYLPSRTPALSDVGWNLVGAAAGIAAARSCCRSCRRRISKPGRMR